jgi:hypothetical protein
VGNLNTFQVTKTDVEKIFQRYGRIAGEIFFLQSYSILLSENRSSVGGAFELLMHR